MGVIVVICIWLCFTKWNKYAAYIILGSMLLFFVNLFDYSFGFVRLNPDSHTNYVSFLTGGAGVISTAFLGFLAVFQNKVYNIENGRFLDQLKTIQNELVEENRLQNKRLYNNQINEQRLKTIENLLSDIMYFLTDINLLGFMQTFSTISENDLNLKVLSTELKLEALRRRAISYTVIDSNEDSNKSLEIGIVEKQRIIDSLQELEEIFFKAIEKYENNEMTLISYFSQNDSIITEKCSEVSDNYNEYLGRIKEIKG